VPREAEKGGCWDMTGEVRLYVTAEEMTRGGS